MPSIFNARARIPVFAFLCRISDTCCAGENRAFYSLFRGAIFFVRQFSPTCPPVAERIHRKERNEPAASRAGRVVYIRRRRNCTSDRRAKLTQYSAANLIAEAQVDPEKWNQLPHDDRVAQTVEAIAQRGIATIRAKSGKIALEL